MQIVAPLVRDMPMEFSYPGKLFLIVPGFRLALFRANLAGEFPLRPGKFFLTFPIEFMPAAHVAIAVYEQAIRSIVKPDGVAPVHHIGVGGAVKFKQDGGIVIPIRLA